MNQKYGSFCIILVIKIKRFGTTSGFKYINMHISTYASIKQMVCVYNVCIGILKICMSITHYSMICNTCMVVKSKLYICMETTSV